MKSERLQILVETVQRERLELAAAARGVSVASLIRTAIDVVYPPQAPSRAGAAAAILSADAMTVPGVDDLVGELDELRARRA